MKTKNTSLARTQDYKITIIIKADVSEKGVKEWLPDALKEGDWNYRVVKLYSTEIKPIDRSDSNYKYLNDMDADEGS
jgi:hypothetical protein